MKLLLFAGFSGLQGENDGDGAFNPKTFRVIEKT